MRRREFLGRSAALAALAAFPGLGCEKVKASTESTGLAQGTGAAAAATANVAGSGKGQDSSGLCPVQRGSDD